MQNNRYKFQQRAKGGIHEMKKIIAALLCAVTFCSSIYSVFAEENSMFSDDSMVSDAGIEAANVILNLGFLWDSYNPIAGMTRKELAEVCVKLQGFKPTKSTDIYIEDVASNDSSAQYIYTAVDYGIMDLYSGNRFCPDLKVTYDELLCSVETILGYNMLIDCSKWSDLYYWANEMGIAENVILKEGTSVKSEYAAIIIYNSLEVANVVVSYGANKKYAFDESETILSRHDIYKHKGIVNGTSVTSISGTDIVGPGYVRINDDVYAIAENAEKYIGYNVEYYVLSKDSDDSVIYIKPYNNAVLKIDGDDIVETTVRTIKYQKDNREKTINLAADIDVIYNSKCVFAYSEDMLYPKNGSITLIDNNRDSKYDVAITEEYKNYFVDDIKLSEYSVSDKNTGDVISLGEDKHDIVYIRKNDEAIEFDAIKRRDIISAYIGNGSDGDIVHAIVSDQTEDVTIATVNEADMIITDSDGIEYKCAYGFDMSAVELGCETKLHFDHKGLVAGIEKNSFGNRAPAILINVIKDELDEVKVKLFTQDNVWVNITADDKIIFNGERINSYELFDEKSLYTDGVIGGVPILYKINAEGKIKTIDSVVQTNNEGELHLTSGANSRRFITYTNSFAPESKYMDLFVDTDSLVFRVPAAQEDIHNPNKYKTQSISAFQSGGYYTVAGYNITEKNTADIVVWYSNASGFVNVNDSLCVVDKVYEAVNASGDVVKMVDVYCDGIKKNIWSDEYSWFENLLRGDVIRYDTETSGNVNYVEKYYSAQSPPLKKQGTTNTSEIINITNTFCTIYGQVTDKNNNFVTLLLEDNPDSVPKELNYTVDKARVYCFDQTKKEIEVKSSSDIEVGDMLFMRSQSSVIKEILIIR